MIVIKSLPYYYIYPSKTLIYFSLKNNIQINLIFSPIGLLINIYSILFEKYV